MAEGELRSFEGTTSNEWRSKSPQIKTATLAGVILLNRLPLLFTRTIQTGNLSGTQGRQM